MRYLWGYTEGERRLIFGRDVSCAEYGTGSVFVWWNEMYEGLPLSALCRGLHSAGSHHDVVPKLLWEAHKVLWLLGY